MNLPTISKACLHRIEKIRNSIRSELKWQPSDWERIYAKVTGT